MVLDGATGASGPLAGVLESGHTVMGGGMVMGEAPARPDWGGAGHAAAGQHAGSMDGLTAANRWKQVRGLSLFKAVPHMGRCCCHVGRG